MSLALNLRSPDVSTAWPSLGDFDLTCPFGEVVWLCGQRFSRWWLPLDSYGR
jgi:hypothetical protein